MNNKKLPQDFKYLPDMYADQYYPGFLVDKAKEAIAEAVVFIGEAERTIEQIQEAFDKMTIKINDLEGEFDENDSELETVARESIAETVERIIQYFELDISTEEAIREREW